MVFLASTVENGSGENRFVEFGCASTDQCTRFIWILFVQRPIPYRILPGAIELQCPRIFSFIVRLVVILVVRLVVKQNHTPAQVDSGMSEI